MRTTFVDIQDIDGTANTIVEAIHSFLAKKALDIDKLRGFATNGASVMVGCRTGVVTQLKQCCPSLISIHCVNHRLALAASPAADHIPYPSAFLNTLGICFLFIRTVLSECQDYMQSSHYWMIQQSN